MTAILNTDELKAELLSTYATDIPMFCRQILPHWFPKPMPWVHRGIVAIMSQQSDFLLNFGEEVWTEGTTRWTKKLLAKLVRNFLYLEDPTDPQSRKLPIFRLRYGPDGRTPIAVDMVLEPFFNLIIPRGFSKTTLCNAVELHDILYQNTKFTVYTSAAQRHAESQIATIRRELKQNDKILSLWGNICPDRMDEQVWRQDEIETTTGVVLVARGRGAQIRGLNRFSVRPDKEIFDDIDDHESVGTEDQRAKTMQWHYADAQPALKIDGTGRIFNLATLLHPDAHAMVLARDPGYTTVKFGASIEEDGEPEPLWADRLSLAQLQALRETYARVGQLQAFGMEYLSSVSLTDQQIFKPENVQRYRLMSPEEFIDKHPFRALCIDPAISDKKTAAYCALAVVGMSNSGFFHVAEVYMRIGMSPREQVDEYFRMSKQWACNRHGVEAVAYQTALSHLLREEMFRKKHMFEIDEKVGGRMSGIDKKKHARVEGILQPRYAAKLITHNERHVIYESQLLDWPHQKKDGPDVVSMCVALCDPYAAVASGDLESLSADESYPKDDADYEEALTAHQWGV